MQHRFKNLKTGFLSNYSQVVGFLAWMAGAIQAEIFLEIPKNVDLVISGFDSKNITTPLHVTPHALIIDVPA